MNHNDSPVRSGTPRAHIQAWLKGLGADRVTVRERESERATTTRYALDHLDTLAITFARIDTFGLTAHLFRGLDVVAILHTPTANGVPIRWEQIA